MQSQTLSRDGGRGLRGNAFVRGNVLSTLVMRDGRQRPMLCGSSPGAAAAARAQGFTYDTSVAFRAALVSLCSPCFFVLGYILLFIDCEDLLVVWCCTLRERPRYFGGGFSVKLRRLSMVQATFR